MFRLVASCQLHTTNSLSASLEEKLGIPARPKKPLTPYFRYLVANRSKLQNENPDLKSFQIVQLCAKKYADIDPALKETYQKEFSSEQDDYIRKRAAYEKNLTTEQRLELSNAKQDATNKKLRIEYKRVSKILFVINKH